MAEFLFYTRFKSQLQRTRPVLMRQLEKTILKSITDAGGKSTGDRQFLKAAFNENAIGFWLDMRLLLEIIEETLEKKEDLLYGYSMIISKAPIDTPEQVSRVLSICGGGIFFDKDAAKGMAPYAIIDEPEKWLEKRMVKKHKIRGFYRLRDLKNLSSGEKKTSVLVENISLRLAQGATRNTLLLGPAFSNKRKSLRHYCQGLNGGFPPLAVCFGRGALNALIDAYTPRLQSVFSEAAQVAAQNAAQLAAQSEAQLAAQPAGQVAEQDSAQIAEQADVQIDVQVEEIFQVEQNAALAAALADAQAEAKAVASAVAEIDKMWEALFKERLRDEVTPFFAQKTQDFFAKLLEVYFNMATAQKRAPVLLLIDIQLVEKSAEKVLFDIFAGTQADLVGKFFVMGTCEESLSIDSLRKWEYVFKRIVKTEAVKQDSFNLSSLPSELVEVAYTLFLFGRHYPYSLFPKLMEEEGKNQQMVSKVLSFLVGMGVIESTVDTEPSIEGFLFKAEQVLGKKTEPIKAMVIRRLLAWVKRGKISPCFRLLSVIKELDETTKISEQLIVEAIVSDLHRGTFASLLLADKTWQLKKISGDDRADSVRYILQTMRFLLLGSEQDIYAIFNSSMPECANHPVLKSQSLVNISAYHLGTRNTAAAMKTIKEAVMLSQDKNNYCLPQLYRLFSLAHLSKQQIGQAVDYLSFAVAAAEKADNHYELSISYYYAAVYQYLFGNLSQAALLAGKSFDFSVKAGRTGWADRARFMEGRIAFEIGSYKKAQDIFEELRKNPLDRSSGEKEQVLAAWHYRARVYLLNPLVPKPLTGGADADLFELEAAYMASDHKRCLELSKTLGKAEYKIDFYFTEQPDWRSGFAQCELMYFAYPDLFKRIISTYQSLSLCHLSDKGKNEAIQNMQNLLRVERFSEIDPWDVFYHYAWYKILEHTKMGQVDISTAISGAFKRLQRRAVRIDDVEVRRLYLNLSRWNGALCESAKEFKLM
ncbi:MAG: hypothetical protein FWG66_16260 [Spirochaetes bacterium]|nr:hypothetical protein [Spirochaetota bacterium]